MLEFVHWVCLLFEHVVGRSNSHNWLYVCVLTVYAAAAPSASSYHIVLPPMLLLLLLCSKRRFCFCKQDEKLTTACDKLAAYLKQQAAAIQQNGV